MPSLTITYQQTTTYPLEAQAGVALSTTPFKNLVNRLLVDATATMSDDGTGAEIPDVTGTHVAVNGALTSGGLAGYQALAEQIVWGVARLLLDLRVTGSKVGQVAACFTRNGQQGSAADWAAADDWKDRIRDSAVEAMKDICVWQRASNARANWMLKRESFDDFCELVFAHPVVQPATTHTVDTGPLNTAEVTRLTDGQIDTYDTSGNPTVYTIPGPPWEAPGWLGGMFYGGQFYANDVHFLTEYAWPPPVWQANDIVLQGDGSVPYTGSMNIQDPNQPWYQQSVAQVNTNNDDLNGNHQTSVFKMSMPIAVPADPDWHTGYTAIKLKATLKVNYYSQIGPFDSGNGYFEIGYATLYKADGTKRRVTGVGITNDGQVKAVIQPEWADSGSGTVQTADMVINRVTEQVVQWPGAAAGTTYGVGHGELYERGPDLVQPPNESGAGPGGTNTLYYTEYVVHLQGDIDVQIQPDDVRLDVAFVMGSGPKVELDQWGSAEVVSYNLHTLARDDLVESPEQNYIFRWPYTSQPDPAPYPYLDPALAAGPSGSGFVRLG